MLQGERVAVTTETATSCGMPAPRQYVVTFTLDGFKTEQHRMPLAAAEVARIAPTLDPAGVAETVEVVGSQTQVLKQSATAATTLSQNVVDMLPLNRGIDATVALTPGTVRSGPANANGVQAISISGASSFENLVLVNGVVIQTTCVAPRQHAIHRRRQPETPSRPRRCRRSEGASTWRRQRLTKSAEPSTAPNGWHSRRSGGATPFAAFDV